MVKFPHVVKDEENEDYRIVYPDDPGLFKDAYVEDGFVIAEYSGDMELEEYTPPAAGQKDIWTTYEFMELVGDANMVAILTAAKSDVAVELFVEKLKRADHVDFNDQQKGPAVGMAFLLSKGLLTQEEHDRIMSRQMAVA